jgi:hypothetical protein
MNQEKYYLDKSKRHAIRTQVIVNKKTKKIISTDSIEGRCRDFALFKASNIAIPN